MAFLVLGILLLALKLAEYGPVGAWSWWVVLAPFGLAVMWWGFADSIGLTQRRAMNKMEEKKVERRNRNLEALGLSPRRDRKAKHGNSFASADAGKRAAKDPVSAAADEIGRR
ncbi:MAG TPA: TIGR04438 family Trp-rich protein [Rubrivivax sp.]|nr:TIGR04438 family Trp-rich protein [Rubrivivax sp.]